MNILVVHPHDPFDRSEPWTSRIRNIAKEFIKKGHKVRLCYFPVTINEKFETKSIDSVEFIPLKRVPSPKAFIDNTLELIRLAKWSDVVHFQKCHHYASIPTVLAAYIAKKPLHYDWDDWEEKIWYESCGKGLHSRFIGISFKILERFLPVLADSVSCASNNLKKLARAFGAGDDYIFDSPVGADIEAFRPGLDGSWVKEKYGIAKDLVLYIGQLHGAQYVDIFIQAANVVLHKNPDVKFMIVGEGFFEQKLKQFTHDLGLNDKIIFTGAAPHDQIPYFISAASVCVAPFRDTEVTRCKSPLKIVEYLASGKPIVASLVGETRNMVGGVGVLVEPGDCHSLGEGILELLGNEELRSEISKRARLRAKNKYNWSHTSESLLSAYEKICIQSLEK